MILCKPVSLPDDEAEAAANTAKGENPSNAPPVEQMVLAAQNAVPGLKLLDLIDPRRIALMTSRYWGKGGVALGVSFLDNPNQATRNRILSYANLCGERANIRFAESSQGEVRVARADDGYWSYIGTDILHIAGNAATMNLQGFTENSPSDAEMMRVTPHEFLHTCGAPHEHSRRAIIDLLDPQKTVKFFQQQYGWSPAVTKQQVLTPVEESSLLGGSTDQDSIMCYSFPGSCTKNGKPITGGSKITPNDHAFLAKQYPKPGPPPGGESVVQLDLAAKVITAPAGWSMQVRG